MPKTLKSHENMIVIDRGWLAILEKYDSKELKRGYAAVGYPGERGYGPSGGSFAGNSYAERAAVHQYGTRDGLIPSRPFMTVANRDGKDETLALQKRLVRLLNEGTVTPKQAFMRLGRLGQGHIRKAFLKTSAYKQLADATLAARRRRGINTTEPLRDTGGMMKAVTYKVVI